MAAADKDWLARSHPVRIAYRNKVKEINRELMNEYLVGKGCADCGEADPIVLELDHMGQKVANVADMVNSWRSWGTILEELAKCEIRCANCHRRKTARQLGWYKARSSTADRNAVSR